MEEERGGGGDTFLRSWGEQRRIYVNSKARGRRKVENEQSPELLPGWVPPSHSWQLSAFFSAVHIRELEYVPQSHPTCELFECLVDPSDMIRSLDYDLVIVCIGMLAKNRAIMRDYTGPS